MSTLCGNNRLSVSTKPNKAVAILSNMRQDIDIIILNAIYHAIIESHFYYSSLVWAKSFIRFKKKSLTRNYNKWALPIVFSLVAASTLNFFPSINSSALSSSLVFCSCLRFLEPGYCLIGVSPFSTSDTSANQRIFFRNNLFK